MNDIYAGCDVDGVVKLFRVRNGEPVAIRLEEWIGILKAHRAEPGEMLTVELARESVGIVQFLQGLGVSVPNNSEVKEIRVGGDLLWKNGDPVPQLSSPPEPSKLEIDYS